MVQAGVAGLDTPGTIRGDPTYLDFDISQEQSFQSPSKDNNNLLQQLQNGRRGGSLNLRTPRSRAVLNDRRNLPAGLGGGEFTPLLKSATRNSALRNGKENVPQTPAFLKPGGLDDVPEELTPLPAMGSSIYGQDSRNGTYLGGTPMPQMESSSAASTPMALLPRRNEGPGVLQDGNQLSLREQENVIDKIEKENFGLKLKIHFLEEALRKAGPGFSEAALKENTELKVDKVTMQKELHRYKKTLSSAERDVDVYRQQIIEMQEKVKRKHADAGQKDELERLRQNLQEKEAEIDRLRGRLDNAEQQDGQLNEYQDKIEDLEADIREKDRIIDDREDEVDSLRTKADEQANAILDLEDAVKKAQRRVLEMEENSHSSQELAEAKDIIEELEHDLERQTTKLEEVQEEAKETVVKLEKDLARQKKEIDAIRGKAQATVADLEHELKRLKDEVEEVKENRQAAVQEKERAEADLEELQDEMANKSITTKGLSRQIEEKANRLQDDLEDLREKYVALEEQHADKQQEIKKLQGKVKDLLQDGDVREQQLRDQLDIVQNENKKVIRERQSLATKLEPLQKELQLKNDEKDLLQVRHDALTSESTSLQRDIARFRTTVQDLEDKLEHEKSLALSNGRDLERSRATIEDLQDKLTHEKSLGFNNARDLEKSREMIDDLQHKLDHEKTLALNNEREVRDQYKSEIDRLHDEIEDLRAEVREKQRLYDDDNDNWDIEKRNLESERDRAEDRAAGLQRTIERLQEAEGTLSGKEMKLQQALQSENDRHKSEEASLSRQIDELNEDVQARRKAFEDARSELSNVKEELRLSQREQKTLAEKIEGLEDEIEILQNNLDDESDHARRELSAAKQESETLKQQLRTLKSDLLKAESTNVDNKSQERLSSILQDVEEQLAKVRQEKQSLQDRLATINIEMHTIRSSAAKAEAERDELKCQLRAYKDQEEETFRLDQERVDLRTTKMKLDNEVRQLRQEKKEALEQQRATEEELQREAARASAEEARLTTQIRELQRKVSGTPRKELDMKLDKELRQLREERRAAVEQQKSIENQLGKEVERARTEEARLNSQIRELQRKATSSPKKDFGGRRDEEVRQLQEENRNALEQQEFLETQLQQQVDRASSEEARLNSKISELRRKIKGSSEKELSSAKRIIRHLEERINELEGQMTTGEGYTDVTSQLDFTRQSLSSARQKETEYIYREGAQKDVLKGLMRQIKNLEQRYNNDNDVSMLSMPSPLPSKGSARKSEVTEVRQQLASAHQNLKDLRTQLKEVERDASRKLKAITNDGQARSDALELERDALQLDLDDALFQQESLKSKNISAGATILKLKSKIERLEKELQAERQNKGGQDSSMVFERRDLHEMLRETQLQAETLEVIVKERERTIANVNATEQELRAKLERVREERAIQRAKVASAQEHIRALERQFQQAQENWEEERRSLTRGVRFPNMSMSEQGIEDQIKDAIQSREVRHGKELKGLSMQIEFLRTCLERETYLRNNAAYVKHMLQTKIDFFRACNKADLKLLGVTPRPPKPHKKPSLKGLVNMVIATERMKKMAADWRKNLAINQRLQDALKEMRRKQGRVSSVR